LFAAQYKWLMPSFLFAAQYIIFASVHFTSVHFTSVHHFCLLLSTSYLHQSISTFYISTSFLHQYIIFVCCSVQMADAIIFVCCSVHHFCIGTSVHFTSVHHFMHQYISASFLFAAQYKWLMPSFLFAA
jgi:hypothetical protein